jgi:Lrp/AsnC family transcriptional regulator for asnA, asnC and gidA
MEDVAVLILNGRELDAVNRRDKINIDDLDLAIIDKLSSNGRAPFSKIAKELATSIDVVMKRYKKLYQGNIAKTTVQINPNVVGYRFILDFNVSLKTPSNSQTIEAISTIPDMVFITKTSGDYDLQMTAMVIVTS